MTDDAELLRRFAEEKSDAALAELVRRQVDFVYAAALRQTRGNAALAQDVAQVVFIDLARKAAALSRHEVLVGWLHTATRFVAAKAIRAERRREAREQEAVMMNETSRTEEASVDWERLQPVLDEVLGELKERERAAILLRFFEKRPFAEVGAKLSLTETAARSCVERGLEKMRPLLARRGVSSTAAALGLALSGHATAAAPAGLAASITGAALAGTVAGTSGWLASFMSVNKLYTSRAAAASRASVAAVAYKIGAHSKVVPPRLPSQATVAAGSPTLDEAERRAVALTGWISDNNAKRPPSASAATMEAEDKIAELREVLARLPEQSIPELKLVTNADWHVAVDGKLETADDYRRALAKLRSLAEGRFGKLAQPALRAYLQANNQQFPNDASQLQSFVAAGIDLAMLQRYKVAPSGEIGNVRVGGDLIVTQRELIDSDYDQHLVIGPFGMGATSSRQSSSARAAETLKPVMAAYRADRGERFADIAELLPYARTPEQRAAIEKLKRKSAEGR